MINLFYIKRIISDTLESFMSVLFHTQYVFCYKICYKISAKDI